MMSGRETSGAARPVQRSLLGTQIADALRRDILLGIVKPGSRLSQQQLCEQFGTSRMPVRDGLRILTHEGLLMTDATQHTIVAPLSRSDLLDSFLIEGTLAGLAAQRASSNLDTKDRELLQAYHEGMVAALSDGDHDAMAELNWKLHRHINRAAHSRKLLSALRTVSLDLPRDFLVEVPAWGAKSNADHAAILGAMTEHRHEDAGNLMREHIISSGFGLIEYLEGNGLELD